MEMETESLIEELLAAAGQAGLEVRQAKLKTAELDAGSGLVKIHGEPVLFLDEGLGLAEKIELLAEALKGLDLENVYLSPRARSLIGGEDD